MKECQNIVDLGILFDKRKTQLLTTQIRWLRRFVERQFSRADRISAKDLEQHSTFERMQRLISFTFNSSDDLKGFIEKYKEFLFETFQKIRSIYIHKGVFVIMELVTEVVLSVRSIYEYGLIHIVEVEENPYEFYYEAMLLIKTIKFIKQGIYIITRTQQIEDLEPTPCLKRLGKLQAGVDQL